MKLGLLSTQVCVRDQKAIKTGSLKVLGEESIDR